MTFDHVTFAYDQRTVLDDVTLSHAQIADCIQPNMAGSTYVVKKAINAPAKADNPAPSMNTRSLWAKELIPITWAASSSVRMARQSRPNLERRTL